MKTKTDPHPFLAAEFTLQNLNRDFVEWHLGRPRYFLWAIDVDVPEVRQQMKRAGGWLAEYLMAEYHRQPHITLCVSGFPADAYRLPEDFIHAEMQERIAALRRLNPRSFEICVGGLSSFSSAPYLTVHDSNSQLSRLRDCLMLPSVAADQRSYTPHVTVGLYKDVFSVVDVAEKLDQFEPGSPISFNVKSVSLMYYESAVIAGPLSTHTVIEF